MRVCQCVCVCVFNWLPHREIESLMDHLTERGERWRDGRAGGGHRSWGTVCQAGELETSAVVWLLVFPRLPDVLSYTQQRYEPGHKRCSSRLWGRWYICPLSWKKDSGQSLLLLQFQLMWFSSGTGLNKKHTIFTKREKGGILFKFIYLGKKKIKKSCQSVVCVSNAPQNFRFLLECCWTGTVPLSFFLNKHAQPAQRPPVYRSCDCPLCTCIIKTTTGPNQGPRVTGCKFHQCGDRGSG